MKTARQLLFGALTLSAFVAFNACSKDENGGTDPGPDPVTSVKRWDVPLDAQYQIPVPTGRTETGTATFELMSDNSLRYSINVPTVSGSDSLSTVQLYAGDLVSNGQSILDLNASFVNGTATDTITGLRSTLADSIETGAVYVNVQSRDLPEGLLRGQLDKTIDYAGNVELTGGAVVPAVSTTANGTAVYRLTSDKILYSNISVDNLAADDSLTTAGLYLGSSDVNGTIIQELASSYADFGITRTDTLTDDAITQLKNDPVYITVASKNNANGLVRGQIR